MAQNEMYLGDGLYVRDTGMIELYTDRLEGRHTVFLEDEVLMALFKFIERSRAVSITVAKRQGLAEELLSAQDGL